MFIGRFTQVYCKPPELELYDKIYQSQVIGEHISLDFFACNLLMCTGLQIYGGPGSLSHDFKIWPTTFQGSGPSGPILFSCEKN